MKKHKVIVADDHDLFREGIKTLLKKIKNVTLCGEAKTGTELVALYKQVKPDMAVIDISMPDMNGIDALKEIVQFDPLSNVIVLSMYDDEDYISTCLQLGAKGYVVKSESGLELRHAIESVISGSRHYSNRVQDVIVNRLKQTQQSHRVEKSPSIITQRESEILTLISQGLTSNEISEKLFISIRTVETHRVNMMRKIDVKNATELIKKALQLKLIV